MGIALGEARVRVHYTPPQESHDFDIVYKLEAFTLACKADALPLASSNDILFFPQ